MAITNQVYLTICKIMLPFHYLPFRVLYSFRRKKCLPPGLYGYNIHSVKDPVNDKMNDTSGARAGSAFRKFRNSLPMERPIAKGKMSDTAEELETNLNKIIKISENYIGQYPTQRMSGMQNR